MVALTQDRDTPRRAGEDFQHPVAASVRIYAGAIVMLNATGYATPGAVATGLVPAGVAQEQVDNVNGADGDVNVAVRRGVFRFVNDGTVSRTDIGGTAYVVDDQTVANNDGTGTRSALGTIMDVDADGVWVQI